jgi:hypothetical protein
METNKKATFEQMETNRKADLENLKRMMEEMLRANHNGLKEMTACREVTKTEPSPGMMQSIEEHQENPKGEAAVMPVGGLRKRCRVCNLAMECHQKRKERTWGKLDPGGSQLPPAGRCPTLQKWHGGKETSSGELGPRRIVGPGRE